MGLLPLEEGARPLAYSPHPRLLASRTVRNKVLLFISHFICFFVITAQQRIMCIEDKLAMCSKLKAAFIYLNFLCESDSI